MAYEDARVVVLGASGFIGRWIARTLPSTPHTYLIVRNGSDLQDLAIQHAIRGIVTEINLVDFSEIKNFLSDIRPSIVFNFAGYGVDPGELDPGMAKQMNAELPRMLCSLLQTHHDPEWAGLQLIQPGSALEYGIATGILSEEITPQPTTTYGITKLEGTRSVLESNIRAIVPRLFNVYGPGEHAGRLFPSLLTAAKNGEELALTPGTQKRDFTYIEDIAEGCLKLGLVTGKNPGLVNLATGKLHSVRQFAEIAAKILKISAAQLHFGKLPFRKEEMDHQGVSTERLRKLIKWTPSTSIEQGVQKTVTFLESMIQ